MATLNLTVTKSTGFGGARLICREYVGGPVVPLAGYSAFSQARKDSDCPVIIDFAPVIESDDADGLITLPAISHVSANVRQPGKF